MNIFYSRFTWVVTFLALVVILLGAYTRLKDAGLGCPDWPFCYGQITVPKTSSDLKHASALFPEQKVEPKKAWLEMVHRYFAGVLGLLIMVLIAWSFIRRRLNSSQPIVIPLTLGFLVIFQAALGMWTVTLSLLPLVVVGHLLGGILIVSLLFSLALTQMPEFRKNPCDTSFGFKCWVFFGVLLVFFQIFLGGWVSANYAALVCPDFPGCHGSWLVPLRIKEAFHFFSPVGMNYEGGVLNTDVRAAIQMIHRYGAFLVLLYVGSLAIHLVVSRQKIALRFFGYFLIFLLVVQFFLGILNVLLTLPVSVSLAHNFVAVLLFLGMIALLSRVSIK